MFKQPRFYRPEPFDDRVDLFDAEDLDFDAEDLDFDAEDLDFDADDLGFDADDLDLDFVLEDFVDGLDVFDDADEEDARLLRLTFLLESERMACSVLRCVLVSTASSSFILADSNSASSCSSAVIFS